MTRRTRTKEEGKQSSTDKTGHSSAKRQGRTASWSKRVRERPGPSSKDHPILHLQRSHGNQAVQRLVRSGSIQAKRRINDPGDRYEQEADSVAEQVTRMPEPAVQRTCACGNHTTAGGECEECSEEKRSGLQTKLKVSERSDIYEEEADRVADQVMAMSAHPGVSGAPPRIQRFAGKPTGQTEAAPASVDQALASPGRPLEPALRQDMEQRFGHDFSRVRVHTDEIAGRSAEAVAAQAYTFGSQVVFRSGRYAPASPDGRHLLAHELAHVVQQSTHQSIARKPDSKTNSPKTPTKSKTVFHPGVMHDHQPSGQWADVQKDPKSAGIIGDICATFSPKNVMRAASVRALYNKPIATDHLKWYFSGDGKDYVEDSNLELMLRTDSGVQTKIAKQMPTGQSSGTFADHVTITQDNYSDEDFQFAFGEIDRLDFEVNFDAGTFHAWFQDRYEWHPVYPFYKSMPGDYLRDTNCVHAAAVELKTSGARDYWMKGKAMIPLKAIRSAASRKDPWREPLVIKGF